MSASFQTPGYTDTEKYLLQALVDELRGFTAAADWAQCLPFTISCAFVMERLGNPVRFTITLYQRVKDGQPVDIKLLLDINIRSSGQEKWSSADGGFMLSHGSAKQVAADIEALTENIQPVQEQLANEYRATFYNS